MASTLKPLKAAVKRRLQWMAERYAPAARQLDPALWNLRSSVSGGLELGGHELAQLAARFGTPLHLLDVARLDANMATLRDLKLDVFCSYKTHPVPAVLLRLHQLGAGAEVISEMELDLALRLGVSPDRIIYNGPAKSERSLRTAIARGILLLNLNHREELPRVLAIARELGKTVRVGVRVNVGSGWSGQFGTSIAGGAAMALFEALLRTPEVEVQGLHSHRGSLIHTPAELSGFVGEVLAFADALHARLGWSPEILDLGGSLGTRTVRFMTSLDRRLAQTLGVEIGAPDIETRLDLKAYANSLSRQVASHYLAVGRPQPRTVVEIGRGLTAEAQMLIASVVTTRAGDDGRDFAVLDAGINIASIMQEARHQIFPLNRFSQPRDTRYRLVGPICQPGDVIQNATMLPALSPGDTLLIMDTGAYFEPDSTVFSFPRPATVMVDGPVVRVIRRRETLTDVISRDEFAVPEKRVGSPPQQAPAAAGAP